MASKPCPRRRVWVTTHVWGKWSVKVRDEDGSPFRARKCQRCGKVERRYMDRGY